MDTEQTVEFTDRWMRSRYVVGAFIRSVVRDEHVVEDLVQNVAIAAAGSFDRYDGEREFSYWLIGIAKRKIAQHFREQSRDRHTFDDDLIQQVAEAHLAQSDDLGDRMTALNVCLGKLNERGKRVIDLRYEQGLKPASIASKIGTSPRAVSSLLHRLRLALRECIERQVDRSEARS